MISIIIPVHNKEKFVKKCLLSVFSQTFPNYELIIVNDGSTDNTLLNIIETLSKFVNGSQYRLPEFLQVCSTEGTYEISEMSLFLENHKKTIPVIIINQNNLGVSSARNTGVTKARYPYLAFLDGDDWWEPDFLLEMDEIIQEFPEAGIYSSSYYLVKPGIKKIAPVGVDPEFKKGIIKYFKTYSNTLCMPVWTGATVIPRKIIESYNGFRPQIHLGEDLDLWIRIALERPVVFLNKPLSNYNQESLHNARATKKLHSPEHHVLWNLGFLSEEEACNPDLKELLDCLRIYALLPYYIQPELRESARFELEKVDWKKQAFFNKLIYTMPICLLRDYLSIRKKGSQIKMWLKKWN